MECIFGKNGVLSIAFPDYEERHEQLVMAKAVDEALENSQVLICEAGTGVGKSLAYLIPSILWCVSKKKRVIISTYTKTLQHQLISHDIPLVKPILPVKFRASLAFGSSNYLCLRKWNRLLSKGLFVFDDEKTVRRVMEWEAETKTGLRSELEKNGKVNIWNDISRTPETCIGKACRYRDACYYERARKVLFSSDIIVVNHHLFFANLAAGGMVLPKYNGVIFDEAHNVENVATNYFGIHLTNRMIERLLNEIEDFRREKKLKTVINETRDASEMFFNRLIHQLGKEEITRIKEKNFISDTLSAHLSNISLILKDIGKNIEDEEEVEEIKSYIRRTKEFETEIDRFLNQRDENSVYWIEMRGKKSKLISLNTAPIEIADRMESSVWNKEIPIILTSATLSTGKKFDFLRRRLGIKNARELLLSSPFNYKRNVMLYIPKTGPDPREENYSWFISKEIGNILKITSGRAFVLFTSFKLMDNVYNLILPNFGKLTLIKQGDSSREEMVERFKNCENSILFGVSTFWQGVDMPGESLLAVILTHLPFEVPSSPIEEARIETIRNNGGNPFLEYQLPKAVMTLKQGFGRLIRRKTDYGLVAILDRRVQTKFYGRMFFNSLPKCRMTDNMEEVNLFFEEFTTKNVNRKY